MRLSAESVKNLAFPETSSDTSFMRPQNSSGCSININWPLLCAEPLSFLSDVEDVGWVRWAESKEIPEEGSSLSWPQSVYLAPGHLLCVSVRNIWKKDGWLQLRVGIPSREELWEIRAFSWQVMTLVFIWYVLRESLLSGPSLPLQQPPGFQIPAGGREVK